MIDKEKYLAELGMRIRAARNAKGISIRKFSKQCNLDASGYWRIEYGRENVKIYTLITIANALDIDVRDFL